MTDQTQNTVIVHFDEFGELQYFVNGENVRLFIVDERAPHDRVYEWLNRVRDEVISEIIPPSSEIGSKNDARHAAITARVNGSGPQLIVDNGEAKQ